MSFQRLADLVNQWHQSAHEGIFQKINKETGEPRAKKKHVHVIYVANNNVICRQCSSQEIKELEPSQNMERRFATMSVITQVFDARKRDAIAKGNRRG